MVYFAGRNDAIHVSKEQSWSDLSDKRFNLYINLIHLKNTYSYRFMIIVRNDKMHPHQTSFSSVAIYRFHAWFFLDGTKHIFTFYVISPHWHDKGGWIFSSLKTEAYIFYIINMGADVLATLNQTNSVPHVKGQSLHSFSIWTRLQTSTQNSSNILARLKWNCFLSAIVSQGSWITVAIIHKKIYILRLGIESYQIQLILPTFVQIYVDSVIKRQIVLKGRPKITKKSIIHRQITTQYLIIYPWMFN